MSMNTYPIIDNGLIINYELAAHIQLALDKAGKNNKSVPKEIQELLDNGTFDQKAESFDMPCDYNEISIVRDALSELDNISYVYCPDFEGAYETLFDKLTDNPIYENINQELLLYIPIQKTADYFKTAYKSPYDIINEIKTTLNNIGVVLPENFDLAKYIVHITGTYYC